MKIKKLTKEETKKLRAKKNLLAEKADKVQDSLYGFDYFWFGKSCVSLPDSHNDGCGEIEYSPNNKIRGIL